MTDPAMFARAWADAWNRLDLEAVLAHFADDVVFSSPKAVAAVGGPTVYGRTALRAYWQAALAPIQQLEFRVNRVRWDAGTGELAIVYDRTINGNQDRALELLGFGTDGRVQHGEVFYGVTPSPPG